MIGLPQPSSLPRSRPNTSANRPALSVARPGTSTRGARGSRDSRTSRSVMASTAMPIGMLIRNTQRQSSAVVSAPPTAGPIANDAPIVAP